MKTGQRLRCNLLNAKWNIFTTYSLQQGTFVLTVDVISAIKYLISKPNLHLLLSIVL